MTMANTTKIWPTSSLVGVMWASWRKAQKRASDCWPYCPFILSRSPCAQRAPACAVRRHFDGFSTKELLEMRSEEHTSELQSLMRISYAVFCLKKKKKHHTNIIKHNQISYQEYELRSQHKVLSIQIKTSYKK